MRRLWLLALVGCSSHARVEAVRSDVRVTVSAPGHSAAELDTSVAVPLVQALSWAHTRATSREGSVTIDVGDADTARIENAIQGVLKNLPADAMLPVVDKRAGARLVRRYVMRSTTVPVAAVADQHAAWRLMLMELPGVRRVDACGARPDIHEVAVDERRMEALGLSIHQIRTAIETARPTTDALPTLPLTTPSGPTVQLKDIASVTVHPTYKGCLARDHISEVIVGEVWATKTVKLSAAPPGLELRELPATTVALEVEWYAGNQVEALEGLQRVVDRALERTHTDAIVEVGDDIHLLVPAADVTTVLDAFHDVPGIIVHAPPALVVGVVGADRTQLVAAATAIETALGSRADGTIGKVEHYTREINVDEAMARRMALDVQDVRDTILATWEGGIELTLDGPVELVLSGDGGRMREAITTTTGSAPAAVRRSDGLPWLGVRASGNPDEIAKIVKTVKLPPGMRWQLERP